MARFRSPEISLRRQKRGSFTPLFLLLRAIRRIYRPTFARWKECRASATDLSSTCSSATRLMHGTWRSAVGKARPSVPLCTATPQLRPASIIGPNSAGRTMNSCTIPRKFRHASMLLNRTSALSITERLARSMSTCSTDRTRRLITVTASQCRDKRVLDDSS